MTGLRDIKNNYLIIRVLPDETVIAAVSKTESTRINLAESNNKIMKRAYNKLITTRIEVISETPILAGSIVSNSLITSVGQELGPTYDMSFDTDSNTGKTFSHEWEAGTL